MIFTIKVLPVKNKWTILFLLSLLFIACESSDEVAAEEIEPVPFLSSMQATSHFLEPYTTRNRFFNEQGQLSIERFNHVDSRYRTYEYDDLNRVISFTTYQIDDNPYLTYTIAYEGELIRDITRFNHLTSTEDILDVDYEGARVTIYFEDVNVVVVFADETRELLIERNMVSAASGNALSSFKYEYDINNNLMVFSQYKQDPGSGGALYLSRQNTYTYDSNPNPHRNMIYPGILLDAVFRSALLDWTHQVKRYSTNNCIMDTAYFPLTEGTIEEVINYTYNDEGYILTSSRIRLGSDYPSLDHVYEYN